VISKMMTWVMAFWPVLELKFSSSNIG
jgi:hypothetical protein